MSRSRRALFIVGILIVVTLAAIGTYFGMLALGELDRNNIDIDPKPPKISYSFNIELKEYNGELYGTCKVVKSGDLDNGHHEEISFIKDQLNNTYKPKVIILDSQNEDVTSSYQITKSVETNEVDVLNLYIQQKDKLEYAGLTKDAYRNTVSLVEGYYLLGPCEVIAEMDVPSFVTKTNTATFYLSVVNKGTSNNLDFFNLDVSTYQSNLKHRIVKIKAFYNSYLDLPSYEIIYGSLVEGHILDLDYYGYEGFHEVKIYEEVVIKEGETKKIDVSRYYDVVVEYN